MKTFLKWTAIAVGAILALAFFDQTPDLTKHFVVLMAIVIYCFWQLSKQVQANHESMVKRTDTLFKMARKNAGFNDEE